jgi:hypothetical protein
VRISNGINPDSKPTRRVPEALILTRASDFEVALLLSPKDLDSSPGKYPETTKEKKKALKKPKKEPKP